jgi:hypothetical protein
MKTTILLALLMVSVSAFAQVVNKPIAPEDKLEYNLDYTRHCLNKFRKEKQLGFELMLGGAIITYLTNNDDINGYNKAYADVRTVWDQHNDGSYRLITYPRTN